MPIRSLRIADVVEDLFGTPSTIRNGDVIYVNGYTTVGDNSAQWLKYDEACEAVIDGGFVFPGIGGSLGFDGATHIGRSGNGRFIALDTSIAFVEKFGALGDDVSDSSSAFQRAANTGKPLRVGNGVFLTNFIANHKLILEGSGSTATILKPFDLEKATIVYASTSPYWTYQGEVRQVGFHGFSKTGIGFSFGKSNPADYSTYDEFVGNVRFFGCHFFDLEKGIQFPFGNIGTSFYDCSWSQNKYGVYILNNKFSGNIMHAGNKYWYSSHFDSNEVAVYVHAANQTGIISFTNTIMEQNEIAMYYYAEGVGLPIVFDNFWDEANGLHRPGRIAQVSIDTWHGSIKGSKMVAGRSYLIEGSNANFLFSNSLIGDIDLQAIDSIAVVRTSQVNNECSAVNSSRILFQDSDALPGYSNGDNNLVKGRVRFSTMEIGDLTYYASVHYARITARQIRTGERPSNSVTMTFTSPTPTGRDSKLTGSVVTDGQTFSTCNQFTRRSFLAKDSITYSGTQYVVAQDGYCVFSFDAKVLKGQPIFFVWNRGTCQWARGMSCPTHDRWYTFGSIAKVVSGQEFMLDTMGSNEDCEWRLSAYQVHYFPTLAQAQDFLEAESFLIP